jgi:hypothetical protein
MGVYERRFAIFPEESGELVIPGQKFTANVINSYDHWNRGRPISIVSKPLRIQVKPAPSTYPNSPWIPSSKIRISEHWSNPNNQWKVGEPITRNIIMNAQGLSGNQLPNITLPIVEGLKYYPDQSEQQDQIDDLGVQGISQQSLAIVPTKSGPITLPEVRIPWWNTETDSLDYAVLPEQTINITEADVTTPIKSSKPAEIKKPDFIAVTATNQAIQTPLDKSTGYWMLATLILLCSNAIFAFLLWKKNTPIVESSKDTTAESSKAALKKLKLACDKNDALLIRQCLKQWTQLEYETTSLEQLKSLLNDSELGDSIEALDRFLYKENGQNTGQPVFEGRKLWNDLLRAIKNTEKKSDSTDSTLKPLY